MILLTPHGIQLEFQEVIDHTGIKLSRATDHCWSTLGV